MNNSFDNFTCPYICPYRQNDGYCRYSTCINLKYKSHTIYSDKSSVPLFSVYCLGSNCKKAVDCARFIGNAPVGVTVQVLNYYSYGTLTIDSSGFVNETWECGEAGNWNMFVKRKGNKEC